MLTIHEPPVEPPEPFCVIAGCGHEVYDGELLYEWEDGKTLCPDCMEEAIREVPWTEIAELYGAESSMVVRPMRRWWF